MKKEQLWAAYVARNPSFAGEGNITMSAAGLRKLFNTTWEHAYKDGWNNGRRAQTPPAPFCSNPLGGIFK